jgi:hypothetical protein
MLLSTAIPRILHRSAFPHSLLPVPQTSLSCMPARIGRIGIRSSSIFKPRSRLHPVLSISSTPPSLYSTMRLTCTSMRSLLHTAYSTTSRSSLPSRLIGPDMSPSISSERNSHRTSENMSQYSGPIGSYTQAVADQTRLWLPLPTINQAITNLKNANVATQAGRALVLDVLASFIPAQPYAIVDGQTVLTALRFSTTTNTGNPLTANVFVALFRNGWEEVMTQLRTAASYSDRLTEKASAGSPAALACTPDLARQQYNDATLAIGKAIQTAQTLITNCTGLYNYHTFEAAYQLLWSATAEPTPPPPKPLPPIGEIPPLKMSGDSRAPCLGAFIIPHTSDEGLNNRRLDGLLVVSPFLPQELRPQVLAHNYGLAASLGRERELVTACTVGIPEISPEHPTGYPSPVKNM